MVLKIAKMSNALETLIDRICIMENTEIIKIRNNSRLKKFRLRDITKNQKDIPAETAIDLNLGEESSMLNRVYESDQSTLS